MKDILISLYEKILAIKEVIPVKEWNDLLDALRLPEPEIKEEEKQETGSSAAADEN